jgi:hypothetical protein
MTSEKASVSRASSRVRATPRSSRAAATAIGKTRPAPAPTPATFAPTKPAPAPRKPVALASDIRHLIDAARGQVAVTINASLTTLYWQIGMRIRTDVLKQKRAGYGEEIFASIARDLERDYGRGFGEKTSGEWCNSPTHSPTNELSPHCGDNSFVAFQNDHPAQRSPQTRILRRTLPARTLEHAHSSAKKQLAALRTHRHFQAS